MYSNSLRAGEMFPLENYWRIASKVSFKITVDNGVCTVFVSDSFQKITVFILSEVSFVFVECI